MYHRIASAFYGDVWHLPADKHTTYGQALQPYLRGERSAGLPQQRTQPSIPGVQIEDGIAMVRVQGIIGKHLHWMEVECAGGYDSALLERQVLELQHRDDVHTVVFSFHSPGGLASGCHDDAQLIGDLGTTKRTVAWVDNECCSAAAYRAAACNETYALGSATVASIGTYCAVLDASRAFEMEGLEMNVFSSGPLKAAGMIGTALTDEHRAFFQERVDHLSGQFIGFMKSQRPGLPESLFDGRYMTAAQGVEIGLIDGIYRSASHLLADLL